MDVLEGLEREAEKVTELNPWLFYTEPLHRLRESGCFLKDVDQLDESKLTANQIRTICVLMYARVLCVRYSTTPLVTYCLL